MKKKDFVLGKYSGCGVADLVTIYNAYGLSAQDRKALGCTAPVVAEVRATNGDLENARILAAAPKLLEALKELLQLDIGEIVVFDKLRLAQLAVEKAKEAVAEAEGK